MTGFDIYTRASATMYVDTGKNVQDEQFTVRHMNTLLQETLPVENNLREFYGEDLLTSAQVITNLDEVIHYHDEILAGALPYALAALYQQEELDPYQQSIYQLKYEHALRDCKKGIWVTIE